MHVQVRLFRAALRLPKYAGLGLPPDTTPVDMVRLDAQNTVLTMPQVARLASWGWLSQRLAALRCSLRTKGLGRAEAPINGEAPTRP